jgi:uncharacterized protein
MELYDVLTHTPTTTLLLPGIGNSGAAHWQSIWERTRQNTRRVQQEEWDHPQCAIWTAALEAAVQQSASNTLLVAHSLGCLQLARWAARTRQSILAAMFVAVPDPGGPNFPKEAIGFAPVPRLRFPFPSIVVASSDDLYGDIAHARSCATAWGSRLIEVGALGHINASSGLGHWPEGLALLDELAEYARRRRT